MKHLFFAFMFLPLFGYSQTISEFDCCLESVNTDTIVSAIIVKKGESISESVKKNPDLIEIFGRYEHVEWTSEIIHVGDAVINGKYREDIKIVEITCICL